MLVNLGMLEGRSRGGCWTWPIVLGVVAASTTATATYSFDFHTIHFYRNPRPFKAAHLVFDFYTVRCDLGALGICLGSLRTVRGGPGGSLGGLVVSGLKPYCTASRVPTYFL